jgi:hypothetical protein
MYATMMDQNKVSIALIIFGFVHYAFLAYETPELWKSNGRKWMVRGPKNQLPERYSVRQKGDSWKE